MVHLDWRTSIHDGKKVFVCVVLDDSSRRILAGGEFGAETTDNALQLLKEAMGRFGWRTSIRQVLTDRGHNSMPTSGTRTAMQIADLKTFLRRVKRRRRTRAAELRGIRGAAA